MNIRPLSAEPQIRKTIRCAVFKLDLLGRFVFVDERFEKMIGIPCENLYGRSIEKFIDKESLTIIKRLLANGRHFESFYESTQLIFQIPDREILAADVIVSLNFIAGNPANFQFTIVPDTIKERHRTDALPEPEFKLALFDYIAARKEEVDWDEFLEIFLKIPQIVQVGIYKISQERQTLISSRCQTTYIGKGFDLSSGLSESQKFALQDGVSYIADGNGRNDGLTDVCYPLSFLKKPWGVLRVIFECDYSDIPEAIKQYSDFLGNALYGIAESKSVETDPII